MKKVILVGTVACGKTTLCQCLNGMELSYKKTQALEVIHNTIDTPGEYLEHRSFLRALITTSGEADMVLFVLDPTQDRFMFSPGQSSSFPIPTAGVITKTDVATEAQIKLGKELLELSGADPIFTVSSFTGEGIPELTAFLQDDKS